VVGLELWLLWGLRLQLQSGIRVVIVVRDQGYCCGEIMVADAVGFRVAAAVRDQGCSCRGF
jgi:hypothetical protein